MTSKQRAYLKSLASKEDPVVQIGKEGLTPENTDAMKEALAARELIKVAVLQNCFDDIRQMAETAAERSKATTAKNDLIFLISTYPLIIERIITYY